MKTSAKRETQVHVGIVLNHKLLRSAPEPLGAAYRKGNDDAVEAEQLGFDFAVTSEHHFAPDGWAPSQLPLLAHLAARTSVIELGTNVLLMAFHNPIRVAEDVATVDLLSGGRFTHFGVGTGSIEDEFVSFGLDPAERWGRMFEGLEIVRRCFTEEAFDHKGRYFRFPNVRMTTKPEQARFPLWVGAYGPKTLARVARGRYHLNIGRYEGLEPYYQALAAIGERPEHFNLRSFTAGHLAPTRDQAWDECQTALYEWQLAYQENGRNRISWQTAGREIREIPPPSALRDDQQFTARFPIGTPDQVLAQLERRLKDTATTHFGFRFRWAGMATSSVRRSMQLFAREVLPVVRAWGREPVRDAR